jgi:hypothetical protein
MKITLEGFRYRSLIPVSDIGFTPEKSLDGDGSWFVEVVVSPDNRSICLQAVEAAVKAEIGTPRPKVARATEGEE